jgi:phosphogluconate dehydratase
MMAVTLHPTVQRVTERIATRSQQTRAAYEADMVAARREGPARGSLSCSNFAHVFAGAGDDKPELKKLQFGNVGIVTAYNDMLSAHQPFGTYPDIIKQAAREVYATAQVAGGVPAMCDGVTQGRAGMELSLFSRDVIAMATAVSLSHEAFDAALMLGVCDKIVPGMFLGAARFGHLPIIFVPGGPMSSGIQNLEKAKVRQRYATGDASREELLEAESASYHDIGTCNFYGTANSNQMLMELMGLHLPGSAFVPPNTSLRTELTRAATQRAARTTALGKDYICFADVVSVKTIVNAIIGLNATGGSTNHTLHLVAMARAVGVLIDWDDFAELSAVTPLLARVYPNGTADVNHFHAAGGIGFLVRELLSAGILHEDVMTVAGHGLSRHAQEPVLHDGVLEWRDAPLHSGNPDVLRGVADPFSADGGLRVVTGNIGRAVIKVSAVKPEHRKVRAPAIIFHSQEDVDIAFKSGKLDGRDFVAVVRFQGPKANGMPELHKLTPPLGVCQDRGQKVALVTDGRMSGASGKVPAAIHLSPEALDGGMISRIMDGDMIHLDAERNLLEVEVPMQELMARVPATADVSAHHKGVGRELFGLMRSAVGTAETGACSIL